jgi:gliding motility-associated-like protein
MLATLLRRPGFLAGLALFFILAGLAHPVRATHLLGGEMSYRYLDNKGPAGATLRYEITVTVYNNCGSAGIASPKPTAAVSVYDQASGYQVASLNIPQTSITACIMPATPPGCSVTGVSQPYRLQKFVGIVNLPASTSGYYALFSDNSRNVDVTNLQSPNSLAMSLYVAMAPPSIPNNSPVFSDIAVAIICANDTTFLLNNAVDADGDRLVYSFGQPYALQGGLPYYFTPPLMAAPYYTGFGYSATTPFGTGAGNFAVLNRSTGLASYGSANVGRKYAVAVDVQEYRVINGQEQLIGSTRRDLQLVVASCPATKSPVLPPASVLARDYSIEAGTSLSIPITATQGDNHPLDLTLNSVLLDGSGGYNATFNGDPGTRPAGSPTGTAMASGANGKVSGTFLFNSDCTTRAAAYDVALTVKDNGCAGKTLAEVFHITVTKPAGPKSITGDLLVCSLNSLRTYTAIGNAAPKLSWRVSGGTIVGSSTDNTVQVKWDGAGTGTVVARGVTQYGCFTDSVVRQVKVSQAATLPVTGNLSICQGGSTTLTVTGGTLPYTVTGGTATLVGNGPFTVSPTQTTRYSITGAAAPNDCGANAQVTVTVLPLPTADVGPASRSACSGIPLTLGTTAVSGSAYSWSPATGLSSTTVANPTIILTNNTSAPFTQSYTLTETSSNGCQANRTVTVTVNPLPVAVPGAAVAFCSGGAAQLGAAPVAGLTYSWSPAMGLSSTTVANPTVTLTNTTSSPIIQTYTLTATSAAGCVSTATVAVTVNPLPVAVPGAAVAFCSGGAAQLGAAPVAGLTYSWSPATGLSSITAANPTLTLTNTTGAPFTQAYTLTATSAAGCVSTATVAVTVNPLPVAVPGAAVAFCSGGAAQLGAAPVAGLTYSWSPAMGLSSTTVANPTVTLTNTTSSPIIQTYTLTATSAAGCVSTATVAVTVNPLPVAVPGAAVAFCSGGAARLGAAPVAGLTYSWSPATGLSSTTVANPTLTLTNTTGSPVSQLYTLTVTNVLGCASTATVAVTVNPLPVAVPGAAVAFCSGGAAQLGAAPVAGLTYSWSPATGLSSTTVANPTLTLTNTTGTPLSQTYTLTATSAVGCVSTATVAVTVNPLPVAVPGAAVAFCSGGAAQLGAASVAGLTYSWSPATGLSSSTAANPTLTLTNTTGAPLSQTYTLTATSAAGCVSTATVAVTVNPLPVAVPGAAVAFCSGGAAQLGAAPVAGLTYSWSPATGLNSTTVANPTLTLTNTTGSPVTQLYKLTVTSALGCTSTATVAVTINPLPVAVPGAAVAFCSGGAAQLGAAPVAGLTYSWSPATGLSSTTVANPTVTLTNTTSSPIIQTYTLTATSAARCVSTATVAVTVNPLPVAVPGAAVAFCSGSSAQLGAAPVAGLSYSWSPATGLSSSTAANPTLTLTNTTGTPLTPTYTLTVTNTTGCVSTATVAVTVNPAVMAVPGGAATICSGGATQLGALPAAGLTYSWSPATGLNSTTVANPTLTLTNTTGSPVAQTYTLTTTNATGCTNTATVAVTVNSVVVPGSIGGTQTICLGSTPAALTSTTPAGGGPGTYAYQWEASADNATWAAVAGATGLTYAPGPVVATMYYRRRVAAGACGTVYSNTLAVQAQTPVVTTIALATPPTQCAGTALTFSPVVANAGPAPTYRWLVNNTLVASTPTFTSSTLADGDQVRVELTPTAGFCASGAVQATVAVARTPVAQPALSIVLQTVLPVCIGTPLTFSLDKVANSGPAPVYQWQVDGVDVAGAQAPVFTSATLRDGQLVTLTLRTTTICGPVVVASNKVRATLNQPVDVEAGPDKEIMEGEQVALEGRASGTYPVTWTPAAGLTFTGTDQLHPLASPLATTTYTLSAGGGACGDSSPVTVTVRPRLLIPSAISPNGDGDNDTWQIDHLGDYATNRVLVFNRWGSKVFETSGYSRSNEWNGTISGQPAPVGTYYYVITLGNGRSYSGPLTVVY